MAKILISSLGTGNKKEGAYQKAIYSIDKKQYQTSFIADALFRHLEIDKIFLVGTNKSIWDEAYTVFGGEDIEYQENLYEKQEKKQVTVNSLKCFDSLLPIGSKSFILDYGMNEDELWNNFEKFLTIAEYIENGDELYLDITHSFRSLSLMSFVMVQFASSISDKNFKIHGVYYGMFEISHENEGITPIVDIKILLEIQEWIKAIDAIKKYSDFDPLVRLLEEEDIEKDVNRTFIQLNNSIEMANLAALHQFMQSASKKINAIKNSNNKIIQLLAPEVLKLIDELNKEKLSDFQYTLSKWFYRNKNYSQSYLALFEAVITKTCELKEPKLDVYNKDVRDAIKGRIDYPYNKQFLENKGKDLENLDSISSIRHNIAHQLIDRKDKVNQDITKLKDFIDFFESYFKK